MDKSYNPSKAAQYWNKRLEENPPLQAILHISLPDYANRTFDKWTQSIIKKNLSNIKGRKVLDVGCGVGRNLIPLAKMGAKVTGVDIAPKMLDTCLNEVKKTKVEENVGLKKADIINLPFEDGKFDLVVCTEVLFHLTDDVLPKAISELGRVLKKNGFCITTLNNHNCRAYRKVKNMTTQREDGYFFTIRNLDKVEKIFKNNKLEETYKFGYTFSSSLNNLSLLPGLGRFIGKFRKKHNFPLNLFYKIAGFLDGHFNSRFLAKHFANLYLIFYKKI